MRSSPRIYRERERERAIEEKLREEKDTEQKMREPIQYQKKGNTIQKKNREWNIREERENEVCAIPIGIEDCHAKDYVSSIRVMCYSMLL